MFPVYSVTYVPGPYLPAPSASHGFGFLRRFEGRGRYFSHRRSHPGERTTESPPSYQRHTGAGMEQLEWENVVRGPAASSRQTGPALDERSSRYAKNSSWRHTRLCGAGPSRGLAHQTPGHYLGGTRKYDRPGLPNPWLGNQRAWKKSCVCPRPEVLANPITWQRSPIFPPGPRATSKLSPRLSVPGDLAGRTRGRLRSSPRSSSHP